MRKFIINDGYLIIGDVEFHEDLVSKSSDKNKTAGGGRWHIDRDKKIIYFWGNSVDFGQVTKEEFDAAFKQPSVEMFDIVFSHKTDFNDVINEIMEKNNNKL